MFKNTAYTEGFVAGTRCLTKRLQPKGEGNCLSNANGWEFGCYTNFIISFKQLTFIGIGGAEGPDRIFVGGLPYYFTEVQIRELLESFGPLCGFDLVKDRDTGNSKGYGLCVYEDQAATDVACAALNGLKMGDKTLTVRRATIIGQMKSEQETIMAQA
uniref:RRM domain-containing protein n=1 Tax=Lactuca sativa TaxID=4236 RepID=A0A9R1ULZ6_LACSA|nr:hypothetical protein LSAT_V11C800408030 [Lactuca sativa]